MGGHQDIRWCRYTGYTAPPHSQSPIFSTHRMVRVSQSILGLGDGHDSVVEH